MNRPAAATACRWFLAARSAISRSASRPSERRNPRSANRRWAISISSGPRDGFQGEIKLEDASLEQDLVVSLPQTEMHEPLIEWSDGGDVFFAVREKAPAALPQPAARGTAPPRYVAIYWDASGSRAADSQDHGLEIGLVKSLLAAWTAPDSGGSGKVEVDLLLLRNTLSPPQRFSITRKNIAELLAALERVDYDGGTQLGAISARRDCYDMALLFSDGISTFGGDAPSSPGGPLYCISADAAPMPPGCGNWLPPMAASTSISCGRPTRKLSLRSAGGTRAAPRERPERSRRRPAAHCGRARRRPPHARGPAGKPAGRAVAPL